MLNIIHTFTMYGTLVACGLIIAKVNSKQLLAVIIGTRESIKL